jgi:hypothetical protein
LTLASTGAITKPVLDESSFQQLLAAAYVVQQHNDGARANDPAQATSGVLSEIAEIQSLVRAGGLDLATAARLTTDRLQKITRADGVAIALMAGGALECVAETGGAARSLASCFNSHSLVPTEGLKAGEFFQSSDAPKDIRLDQVLCREAGVGSLIAAPIHRFDEFDGLIEVRWTRPNAFQESDTRATRLMAGLISGLRERNARAEERRRLQLTVSDIEPASTKADDSRVTRKTDNSWAATSEVPESELRILPFEAVDPVPAKAEPAQVEGGTLPGECRVCGRRFGPDEAFCGQCSMPRVAGAPSEELQSKWASLWYMQQAQETQTKLPPLPVPSPDTFPFAPENAQPRVVSQKPAPQTSPDPPVRIWHVPEADTRRNPPAFPAQTHPFEAQPSEDRSFLIAPDAGFSEARFTHTSNTLTSMGAAADASEAGASPDLLQSTWQTVWARMRRRHATLALSAVGLLLLFLMLAVWPSSNNSQLTWFQSVLVQLGLAEVPTHAPVLSGNPDVRVWVDVHTALYYCPGSDLYGKTPGGHFASQHDAQVDEFEPASRVACP